MPNIKILRNDVSHAFAGLNPQKAYGPDGVIPIVLFRASTSPNKTFPSLPINFHLCCLLKVCLHTTCLKKKRVITLIPQTTVLLLWFSAFVKYLSLFLTRRFSGIYHSHPLIDRQYGFQSGRSTVNPLLGVSVKLLVLPYTYQKLFIESGTKLWFLNFLLSVFILLSAPSSLISFLTVLLQQW